MIIAIDGPAASGKGTLAKGLATYFNYAHLDTGSLYRAVALTVTRNGIDLDHAGRRGSILDGRDIGTTICPDADVKLYITASLDIRAKRRFAELSKGNDQGLTYEGVFEALNRRDRRDSQRATAPLLIADDAITIDTSHMTPDKALQQAISACTKQRIL